METGRLIKQIGHKLDSRMNERLKEYDVTNSQFGVLIFLYKNRESDISQKCICDFFNIKHTSLIDILKRLQQKGLVEKKQNESDSRQNTVFLSEKGFELCVQMEKGKQNAEELILSDFSEEEKILLEKLLMKVKNNLDKGDDENG